MVREFTGRARDYEVLLGIGHSLGVGFWAAAGEIMSTGMERADTL